MTFTRPFYRCPAYSRYKGKGDPNEARKFVPVMPLARSEPSYWQGTEDRAMRRAVALTLSLLADLRRGILPVTLRMWSSR